MKKNYQKILFLTSATFVLFLVSPFALLATSDFVALQPKLPGITYDEGFEGLFNGLFQIGVITSAFLAIIFIGIGGVQYMTTEAVSSKEGAKERITSALSGLFLVLLSVILLNVINPDIVKFTLFEGVTGLEAPTKVVVPSACGEKLVYVGGECVNPTDQIKSGAIVPEIFCTQDHNGYKKEDFTRFRGEEAYIPGRCYKK